MLTFLPEWRGLPPEAVTPYAPGPDHGETNHPNMRGFKSRLPYPDLRLCPTDEEFDYEPSEERDAFFWWCNEKDIWTLSYSAETLSTMVLLEDEYPDKWQEVCKEIYPSQSNESLHLKHGSPSAYSVSGCRGPLCRAAIRQHMRDWRTDTLPTSDLLLEVHYKQIAKSFQHYQLYMHAVRKFRVLTDRRKRDDPLRWQRVTLRDTILMDCTEV